MMAFNQSRSVFAAHRAPVRPVLIIQNNIGNRYSPTLAQVETGDGASGFFIKSSPAEILALLENPEISTPQTEEAPQTLMAPTFTG